MTPAATDRVRGNLLDSVALPRMHQGVLSLGILVVSVKFNFVFLLHTVFSLAI